jgi:hypothetical protein
MKTPLFAALLFFASLASAQPAARLPSMGLPRFQGLLQTFVTTQFGRSFQALGDERDFDHGHLLFDKAGKPLAVLYHTQEDSADAAVGPRSWLQWIETGAVEDAARYARKEYPSSAYWQLFVSRRLPQLRKKGTVTDQMLDPALVPVDPSRSEQWVFTRAACGPDAGALRLVLPGAAAPVCLVLSAS